MSNPVFSFVGMQGQIIDWSGFVGEVCRAISGHDKPITREELAVLVGKKQRENTLARALMACKGAGESTEAKAIVRQILG